jgi:hypothetical protein
MPSAGLSLGRGTIAGLLFELAFTPVKGQRNVSGAHRRRARYTSHGATMICRSDFFTSSHSRQ